MLALLVGMPTGAFARNVVTSVTGQPVLERKGEAQVLEEGMEIFKGDKIKTVENSQVDVSLNGGSGVRMLASSEALIKDTDPDNTELELELGNVIVDVRKKLQQGRKFQVETPTAVLAVRGTQFWGQVSNPGEAPKTVFAVREGTLDITCKASSRVFKVEAGKALELPSGESSLQLRDAKPEELGAIAQCHQIRIEKE